MAAIFMLPRSRLFDADGQVIPGGLVRFYNAGTTTPRTVYSDSSLSTPISQPVTADSGGLLPLIFMQTGAYKIVASDADDVTLYTADNLDSGIPAGSGALAIANGGTGATTAAGARTALSVPAQSVVDALSASVSAIQAQITAIGGTLGALAGRADITRSQLAAGFGRVEVQNKLLASSTSVVTCAGTYAYDNSIPQNSGGTQILSGTFAPLSASSTLVAELVFHGALPSSGQVTAALFKDTAADAVAMTSQRFDSSNMLRMAIQHYFASPGTSTFTLAARVGGSSGTFYVNGNSSGTRVGGGVMLAFLRVREVITF